MFFLIPIGHNRFVVRQLPFVTIGFLLACIALFIPTQRQMSADALAIHHGQQALFAHYNRHPHLEIPDALYDHLSPELRDVVSQRLHWRDWYDSDPDEASDWAEAFLAQHAKQSQQRGSTASTLVDALNPFPSSGGCRGRAGCLPDTSALTTDIYKARAIQQLATQTAPEHHAQQSQLDQLADALIETSQGTLLRRFAFWPNAPQLPGILTYALLHGGVLHLVFNLLFLWLAAVKLEDIWGRWLFAGLFILFAVGAALAHMARFPTSDIPVIGASGAVAGLMGAFLIRLSRTRIRFFYFLWFFRIKPYTGVFHAKAYAVLPLWFGLEVFHALFTGGDSVAYWTHVGGFVLGALTALIFRVTDFETRVLKRHPDDDPDIDDEVARQTAPLVAFQHAGNASANATAPPTLSPVSQDAVPDAPAKTHAVSIRARRELLLQSLTPTELRGTTPLGRPITLSATDISAVALGRIERVQGDPLSSLFSAGIPHDPAHIIALVEVRHAAAPPPDDEAKSDAGAPDPQSERGLWLIDTQKCPWSALFPDAQMNSRTAVKALTRALLQVFSHATYIKGGAESPDKIPIYQALEDFIRTAEKKTTPPAKSL
ncbi:MAG: rhomboid family intramembrane serine protease [Myxococcales bacterium]|nr:rhomboid family intramembrane serine protease [Myxococcales bacterium]